MESFKTTRVRPDWVNQLRAEYGTDVAIASAMGVDKATVGRWLSGSKEATGRFIGSVMLTFPVKFDEAFICVKETREPRQTEQPKAA
ncbi:hypothetical protein [Corynebacterium flavescens]|uniref:hypothetical protein n=1 Tax=Corynebacterium flavescens TaxID=28028 RepID=UPI002649EA5C|nr:hypothetical protein [Corynebacterium flavescens]MDN6199343.1 hypothetical protein [Corynebacterium flavescens]MDN6654767.1 hypothetical protein [Bifidobacterium crudilactis]